MFDQDFPVASVRDWQQSPQKRRGNLGVDFAGGVTVDDSLVRAATAIESGFLRPHLVSGGFPA